MTLKEQRARRHFFHQGKQDKQNGLSPNPFNHKFDDSYFAGYNSAKVKPQLPTRGDKPNTAVRFVLWLMKAFKA